MVDSARRPSTVSTVYGAGSAQHLRPVLGRRGAAYPLPVAVPGPRLSTMSIRARDAHLSRRLHRTRYQYSRLGGSLFRTSRASACTLLGMDPTRRFRALFTFWRLGASDGQAKQARTRTGKNLHGKGHFYFPRVISALVVSKPANKELLYAVRGSGGGRTRAAAAEEAAGGSRMDMKLQHDITRAPRPIGVPFKCVLVPSEPSPWPGCHETGGEPCTGRDPWALGLEPSAQRPLPWHPPALRQSKSLMPWRRVASKASQGCICTHQSVGTLASGRLSRQRHALHMPLPPAARFLLFRLLLLLRLACRHQRRLV